MSAQDKLDRRAAKHGLGSDERKRKIQKAKDFFSKPVPTYSKDELRKMGHPVESSAEYGKSMDRIRDKEKNAAIKPKDRDTLGKLADLMKKQKRNEAYRKPTQAEIDADKKKEGKGKDSSTRYRDMKKKVYGNAMGGLKDAAGQEYTAVPTKTGDASKADRLSIAKMDAIMKKRSKDKRQKESVNLEENKIFFVKVGTGRDHMTVKVKAPNSREALKKMRAQHPKDKVALDQNQKQGRSAGALESVETNESSLPPHLQKIIGKDGQIDKKKVDQHGHGKKTKVTDVTPKGYGPKEDVDEATMADRTVLRAVRIAKDMAGNHTGASKRIEKMKKGLSDHPKVKDALRSANESVATADKKPQNFRDPETGKLKVRMVPVDRDVVRGNDAAKSVARKKRFKHMRKEQMATGNSRVGKDGRDAFMKAFKDIQKTAAEIQRKKDADKK